MPLRERPFVEALCVHGAVFVVYAAISIAITWPLVLRLGTAVPHDLGDPVGFTWIIWWNAQAWPLTTAWLNAPMFYPSPGVIVFQDSLLGVSPFTTVVQAIGGSPLAAHNLLLIGSFAASAWTAYLLCARLFGDRRAAFAGGVVFGFALYRMVQLPHVNVLLTFWTPLVLLGLHEYLTTRRWRWLAMAAACWALQALSSGYFLVYSSVLVGLWALFFLRRRIWDYARLAVAFGVALCAIWPWLSLYRAVQASYAFQRNVSEAEFFAADVTGLLKAPYLLAVWGPLLGDPFKEGQLFPGLVLAAACLLVVVSSHYWAPPRSSRASRVFLCVAGAFALIAAIAVISPASFRVLGIGVSLGRPYKPLAWAWVSLLLAMGFSPPVRRVLRDRSVAGFYALAAFALWILALGPTIRFLGARIWYKAPYSWLLTLPGSNAVRVPARLWLLAVLALAVVVAYGLTKLRQRVPRAAPAATTLVCLGLLAEAWLGRLPLPNPPERFAALESRATPTPVLELPLGSYERDLAAMYRSMYHRAPIVNGYSAYTPASFAALVVGLGDGDPLALMPFSERMPLDIVIHTGAEKAEAQAAVVEAAGAKLQSVTERFKLYHLPQRPPVEEPSQAPAASIERITDAEGNDATRKLTDEDPFTFAITGGLDVTLARRCRVNEVELGAAPGLVGIAVRGLAAGGSWQDLWSGSVAERSVRAALAFPRSPRLRLRIAETQLDRLKIDLRVPSGENASAVMNLRALGPDCGPDTTPRRH